jgi:hypothetical protein
MRAVPGTQQHVSVGWAGPCRCKTLRFLSGRAFKVWFPCPAHL